MNRRVSMVLMTGLLGSALLVGCSYGQKGVVAGAGVGALAGQAIGRNTKSTLIGTAVGGTAGYIIGAEKDRSDMQRQLDHVQASANTVAVNIANSNGSISTVMLHKQGGGFVGPHGEYYDRMPSEEQLQAVYGF